MTDEFGTDRATRRRAQEASRSRQSRGGAQDTRLDAIRDRVREDLGQARFGRYLGQGARIEAAGESVEVVAPSTFMAQVLDRNVVPAIRRAMEAAGESTPAVRVRVERQAGSTTPEEAPSRPATAPRPAPGPAAAPSRRKPPAGGFAPRARLEDFLVGESNRLAHRAALRIAEGIDDAAFSPLFLHGPSGVGKTHLLEGIARRTQERNPGARVRYVTAEAFTNEFINAIQNRGMDSFRKTWRGVTLLCIDDVHFLRGKQSTQTELLHTLDAVGLRQARIVLASDEPPRKIAELSDQLVSRFMGGAVVRIDEPDDALCRQLLVALAARRGLVFTEDGISMLVQRGAGTEPAQRPRDRGAADPGRRGEAPAALREPVGAGLPRRRPDRFGRGPHGLAGRRGSLGQTPCSAGPHPPRRDHPHLLRTDAGDDRRPVRSRAAQARRADAGADRYARSGVHDAELSGDRPWHEAAEPLHGDHRVQPHEGADQRPARTPRAGRTSRG
ncbi:MAG: ATP-binding protein [Planctomycetota bacterium]|nr:MAG: ATP-binding protein [Planctomycetota bacterium]